MSFGLRVRPLVTTRHVDAMLSAYADRTLPASTLLACDQHVAICPRCRDAADAERRLLSSLRTSATPALPSRLELALLGLAVHAVPAAPASKPSRLVVVRRSAPAMHRSPMRAAMLASLAAGASAAAAWSVGVSSVGPSAASHSFLRAPAPAATARLSGDTSASSQPPALSISQGAAAGIAGPIQLTTSFTAPSLAPAPVSGPAPDVRYGNALGTIEP
jgi:Putative zinc-finger